MKAVWQKIIQPASRRDDYLTSEGLISADGKLLAAIEQFRSNPGIFYANAGGERSGAIDNYDWARQWCETKVGNKVN